MWKTMDAAPKDTPILGYMPEWTGQSGTVFPAQVAEIVWYDNEWRFANHGSCGCCWGSVFSKPVRWAEIPKPSKVEATLF